ncbi:CPBP family intramembrane metalloprotease [Corynebacterium silvaticum]|nr:CPBP family intramembrane metalloprotease [Corynebacterium silvaticum]UWH04177.1 CPBP family intramembrane metalloprotease [Corynebacterium silvaticum]UXZ26338.1 CPBP family intramembrane metalloprotease [Corynebacterium silvaticum]UXZ28372.1 CPBP family intramembrane metalloprotease [Corynebacterium silvaticum]UXZ30417.1 CPBP family intramembrane metalloprotease [Corynebacterium silvaticum]
MWCSKVTLRLCWKKIDASLVLFSLQNGFYEEIFFLGIFLSVAPKYRVAAFIFSLVVRTIFHTYQGLASALGIGLILGSIFYFLYTRSKDKNLYTFFLAHAICDVVGLAVLYLLY